MRDIGLTPISERTIREIFAGSFPRVTMPIIAGEDLEFGSLVKIVSGKAKLVTAKTDKVYGIVADEDGIGNNSSGVVYTTGEYLKHNLIVGGTSTIDEFGVEPRACLFIKENRSYQ